MSGSEGVVHVAFLPSAGMGLLNPCLRIEALFLCYGCKVTLITPKPTVSIAESISMARHKNGTPLGNKILNMYNNCSSGHYLNKLSLSYKLSNYRYVKFFFSFFFHVFSIGKSAKIHISSGTNLIGKRFCFHFLEYH